MTRLAIFASGGGSNAQCIMDHFNDLEEISIALILSNRKKAGVLDRARKAGIRSMVFSKAEFQSGESIKAALQKAQIDVLVLAGFLLKVPPYLLEIYSDRILNIHPALLPKYGGKGMYGAHVHQAVYENKDSESGITIHLVNEKYDDGKILFQASTEIESSDSPEIIGKKVLELEHYYFPRIIEAFVENSFLQD